MDVGGPAAKLNVPVSSSTSLVFSAALLRVSYDADVPGLDQSGYGVTVAAGARFFLAEVVSLDALLAYGRETLEYDGLPWERDASTWDLRFALSFFLGGR